MAHDDTAIGVSCTSCGPTSGHFTADALNLRCDECGRFAEKCRHYCARHGVDKRHTPSGMGCPYCKMEAERDALMAERMAKPEHHHPTVDAPRY